MITLSILVFVVVIIALCILATLVSGLTAIIMIPFKYISSLFKGNKNYKNNTERKPTKYSKGE